MLEKIVYLKTKLDLLISGAKATGGVSVATADAGIEKTIDTVIGYVPWLGAGVLIFGIVNIILAFMKEEQDSNAITKSMKYLIVGGLLIAFGLLWDPISTAFGL